MVVASSANSPDRNDPDVATNFQWRQHFNNSADSSNNSVSGTNVSSTKFPLWLRIVRNRDQIAGWQSGDGTTFTQVGGDSGGATLDRMAAQIYIGFAVTNHRDGDFATAKFDANSVKFQ